MQERSLLPNSSFPYVVWTIWIAVAALLHFGPNALPKLLESATIQTAGIGLNVVTAQKTSPPTSSVHQSEIEQLRATQRVLVARVATLQNQLLQFQSVPSNITNADKNLVTAKMQPARVLGARHETHDSSLELLISLGKQQGLVGEELVLKGPGILIDQGEAAGVILDQLVSESRVLFGRIHKLGRWSSLVQPISDPDFRIAVRLVRSSALGPVWGATGILSGTGTGCEIREVSATEPVAIGDYVYTQPQLSTSSEMIYCGQVTHASIEPSDTHWKIQVSTVSHRDELPTELSVIQSHLSVKSSR